MPMSPLHEVVVHIASYLYLQAFLLTHPASSDTSTLQFDASQNVVAPWELCADSASWCLNIKVAAAMGGVEWRRVAAMTGAGWRGVA